MTHYKTSKNEHTTLYKIVEKASVPFWAEHEYVLCKDQFAEEMLMMERNCPFEIKETFLDRLAIVASNRMKGIANLNGDIILPCSYEKVEITTFEKANKVCDIHIVARIGRNITIFHFDGEKAVPFMNLEVTKNQKGVKVWKSPVQEGTMAM